MFIKDTQYIEASKVRTPNNSPYYELLLRENDESIEDVTLIGNVFTEEIARLFMHSYNMYKLLKLMHVATEGNMSEINKVLSRLLDEIEGRDQEAKS